MILKSIYREYERSLQPPDDEPIYEWARHRIKLDSTSPIAGYYRIENSPWLREIFHAFQAPETRMVTSLGPNQGGRTKAMEVASIWSVKHRAGPMQWNGSKDDKAEAFAEKRWWPMARSCAEIVDMLPDGGTGMGDARHKVRKASVIFKNGMPFTIQGSAPGNLQEDSIMTQFNDECFQWPVGRLEDAWIRCNVAYAWNHKIWNGSVAGLEDDDVDKTFKEGTQEEWHWKCLNPACGHLQIPRWGRREEKGGIKWEENEFTRPKGEWSYVAVAKTVYYECESCGQKWADTPRSRRLLNHGACYVAKNPGAGIKHRSFRFNILTVNWPGLNWAQWVVEFLKAVKASRHTGNHEPLRLFWTRRMVDPWNEQRHINSNRRIIVSDYKLYPNAGDKNFYIANKWENEAYRFMANDKQEIGYWYAIRAARQNGESRLIERGNLSSYSEIDAKAKEFRVIPKRTLIDCSYEPREVFASAIKYGWTCFAGDDRPSFKYSVKVSDGRGGEKILKIESPHSDPSQPLWGDPGMGGSKQQLNARATTRILARKFLWSTLAIKDMLTAAKQGRSIYWGVPSDCGDEYLKQINSEIKFRVRTRNGPETFRYTNSNAKGTGSKRPNHYWDCECMIFCAMIMQGLIDISGWNGDSSETIESCVDATGEDDAKTESAQT